MEKRADWIKEIYVDQADNSNKLKAQTDVTDSKVLTLFHGLHAHK